MLPDVTVVPECGVTYKYVWNESCEEKYCEENISSMHTTDQLINQITVVNDQHGMMQLVYNTEEIITHVRTHTVTVEHTQIMLFAAMKKLNIPEFTRR